MKTERDTSYKNEINKIKMKVAATRKGR